MLNVKIKKLSDNAVIPSYAHDTDAGLDLTATSKEYDEHGNVVYGTGLAFAIPDGYVGLIYPRSSNAKKDLLLSNSVGVIDSGYRGEVIFKFKCALNDERDIPEFGYREYDIGDRIGQLIIMPYPKVQFDVVDDLDKTERGTGGFGSTGEK